MEERKSNLIPRPSSPSLSRKIKSSFNPRDPKQGGGRQGGRKARTKDVLYYVVERKKKSKIFFGGTRRKRYWLRWNEISSCYYSPSLPAESFSTPPPPPLLSPRPPALNIFKLSPLENSAHRHRINHTEEARSGRGMGIWIRATRDHDEFI